MINSDLHQLIKKCQNVDILALTKDLGITLQKSGSNYITLCPFHNDSHPSMTLYEDSNNFHCFTCGAHGDNIALVKQIKNMDFIESLKWIFSIKGWIWPESHISSINGWKEAEDIFTFQLKSHKKIFSNFAHKRSFSESFLKKINLGLSSNDCLVSIAKQNRSLFDAFLEIGLLKNKPSFINFKQGILNLDWAQDYFYGKRIIFPIENSNGYTVGFAGRAINNDTPKYLYTKGLKKSEILYRYSTAKSKLVDSLTKDHNNVDLYVVEGLMDALRLESLGIYVVAILGAQVSKAQLELIGELSRLVEKQNKILNIHIFLDSDDAGCKGTKQFITNVVKLSFENDLQFLLDIIIPIVDENKSNKIDPDNFLKSCSIDEAIKKLEKSTVTVIDFLLSEILGCSTQEISSIWKSLSFVEKTVVLRRVENVLGGFSKAGVAVERLGLGTNKSDTSEKSWIKLFKERAITSTDGNILERKTSTKHSDIEALKHAFAVARTSAQRREMPSDSNGWRQIDMAADIFQLYFKKLLNNGKEGANLGLMMSYPLPRMDGDFRLKAVPCNEVLLLQQYLLNQILTPRDDIPELCQTIPAVRKWRGTPIETTGLQAPSETVSFAYQIDMDIIEGRIKTPQSSGMFVHYFDCWTAFVKKIDGDVSKILKTTKTVYMSRLDIKRYYDNVSRQLVIDSLNIPLKNTFEMTNDNGFDKIAPLFSPDENPSIRADKLLDWLCASSFGYRFESYKDGNEQKSPNDLGLPQGPDLSAYLANIALFPLDKLVCDKIDKVNEETFGIGYSRYVDDLVLVASSREKLVNISQLIEQKLQQLGLELNRKHQDLPPMDENEARLWITDQRGGLGVSILGELPFINQKNNSVFYDVTENMGRREALAALANPELFDVNASFEKVEDELKKIAQAKELRFGDIVKTSLLIWWRASQKENSFKHFQSQFNDIFPNHERLFKNQVSVQHWHDIRMLITLESLERFLSTRRDRMPTQNEKTKTDLRKNQCTLATHILATGLDQFWNDDWSEVDSEITHAINLRKLAVLNVAFTLEQTQVKEFDLNFLNNNISNWIKRQIYHLHASGRQISSFVALQEADDPLLMIHESIARLRHPLNSNNSIDPLQPLVERINNIDNNEWLSKVLSSWVITDSSTNKKTAKLSEPAAIKASLNSFINCCSDRNQVASLLVKRKILLNGLDEDIANILPVPPGVNYPGIMWKKELTKNCFHLMRKDFIDTKDKVIPNDWKEDNSFDFTNFDFVTQKDLSKLKPSACSEVVKLFHKLHGFITENSDDEYTILSFVGNVIQSSSGEDKISIITYKLLRTNIGANSFIAPMDGISLLSKEIPKVYSDIWRIGVTLADLWSIGTEYLNDDDSRLMKKTISGEENWETETMLRIGFSRLTGRTAFNLRQDIDTSSNDSENLLPSSVLNMLKYMERFGQSGQGKLAMLCCALYDMKASMSRNSSEFEALAGCGVYAHWISHLAGAFFNHDEVMMSKLSVVDKDKCSNSSRMPMVSYGWLNLASRVEPLIKSSDDVELLRLLSAGAYLKAIEQFSKTIAVTLAFSISSENKQKIVESVKNGITDINIDFSDMKFSINRDIDNDRVLSALFTGKEPQVVNSITSCGWLTIVAILGGLLGSLPGAAAPTEGRVSFKEDLITKCSSSLKILNSVISGNEYPYLSIKKVTENFNIKKLEEVFETNIELAIYFGITFNIQKNSNFLLPGGKSDRPKIQLGAKSISLNRHSILVQRLKGEVAQTPLATTGMDEDNVDIHIWEEIFYQKKLAGISVWSEPFAKYANITYEPQNQNINKQHSEIDVNTIGIDLKISDTKKELEDKKNYIELNQLKQKKEPVIIEPPTASSIDKGAEVNESSNSNLDKLKAIQRKAWGYRSEKSSQSHLRIALLQMKVDDSYCHPIFEDASISKNAWTSDKAENQGFLIDSKNEYRRRQIIKNSLDACEEFCVDVVVLPEYSTRPETILFVRDYLTNINSKMTIWAGTCRIPEGYAPMGDNTFKLEPWTAVLPVVYRSDETNEYLICTKRNKRYGSIAAHEWFNPMGNISLEPISDVLNWRSDNDLKAYCTELICAEVFIANPANLPSLAEYRRKMLFQLGISTNIDTKDMVLQDLAAFSKNVSLTRQKDSDIHRKSIMLIPAYTSRAVDYAIFGQASYLSAGLITVLCNAVGDAAYGRSCFIGDACWDNEKDQLLYKQRMGPYHGVFPGIYRQSSNETGHGALGKKEQAIVIADIDPINTVPGNPRQQTLLAPMELVAHLPIIEHNDNTKVEKDINDVLSCLRSNVIHNNAAILEKLVNLENQDKKDSGLYKRYEAYQTNYKQLSAPSPLPCLIDWIPIFIDKTKKEKIFAPPYSVFGSDRLKTNSH